jgi:oxidase EvaA
LAKSVEIHLPSGGFLDSSLRLPTEKTTPEFESWYSDLLRKGYFKVEIIPLSDLDQWIYCNEMDRIAHVSNRFFSIEGLRVRTNFAPELEWDQPIINQPEIGILGILTKVISGIRVFLMQAKMEPGNINALQISPTVQATKSNFTQVHGGKVPPYLEYFSTQARSRILFDSLQPEQGSRFFRKRNRNMLVEVDEEVEVMDGYRWFTLRELKNLLKRSNLINMDARSVISTIPLIDESDWPIFEKLDLNNLDELVVNGCEIKGFGLRLVRSACAVEYSYQTDGELISWLTSQRVFYELQVERKPLGRLVGWNMEAGRIHSNGEFFEVIGVSAKISNREIGQWSQPLIFDPNLGLSGFLVKNINGILHFLVQAKVEPGNPDVVLLAPTVTCSRFEKLLSDGSTLPFLDWFHPSASHPPCLDVVQSEEGGRFYQLQNRNVTVEAPEQSELELPKNYMWFTLRQIMKFIKFGLFNIEARNLISAISITRSD